MTQKLGKTFGPFKDTSFVVIILIREFKSHAERRIIPSFTRFTSLNETPARRHVRCGGRFQLNESPFEDGEFVFLVVDGSAKLSGREHYRRFRAHGRGRNRRSRFLKAEEAIQLLPQWRGHQRMVKHMVHFLDGAGEKLQHAS